MHNDSVFFMNADIVGDIMENVMVHDIREEYLELDLTGCRLTFDDGLFSQFYYYPLLRRQSAGEMVYFIISSCIRPGEYRGMFAGEYIPFQKSKKYMYKALLEDDFSAFMRVEELQELAGMKDVRLGVHSHFHDVIPTRNHPLKKKRPSRWKLERIGCDENDLQSEYSIRSKLAFQGYTYRRGGFVPRPRQQWLDYIKYDTEAALQWFATFLGQTPDTYCFPLNEHNRILIDILKTFGFRHFYSRRLIPFCEEIICRTDIDSRI